MHRPPENIDDLLNVRYLLSRTPQDLPLIAVDDASGLRLYARPKAYARVFLASQYGAPPNLRSADFTLLTYTDHVQRFQLHLKDSDLAIFSEVAYPGWCARVDGKSVPIQSAVLGGMPTPLRALALGPADHEDRISLRSISFTSREMPLTRANSAADLVSSRPSIAVLIPCRDEARTIGKVVGDFRTALPDATILVFDNASRDGTAAIAAAAGATVRHVALRGKGNVVRRMFADVDADTYLLIDGDDTYDVDSAAQMLDLQRRQGLDMVVGVRAAHTATAYRRGHVFGNHLLTHFLSRLFGHPCRDVLSGYRVLSRRFVKSFPVLSRGFEIETELTVHALELSMPIGEITTAYRERPPGSRSKLSTYRDGAHPTRDPSAV